MLRIQFGGWKISETQVKMSKRQLIVPVGLQVKEGYIRGSLTNDRFEAHLERECSGGRGPKSKPWGPVRTWGVMEKPACGVGSQLGRVVQEARGRNSPRGLD